MVENGFADMISVVIPSYNRCEAMRALLGDLRAQEGVEFEVVVVDDCSPDESVDTIRREFPEVRLFVNEENSGPSVTRNRAIREATGEVVVGFDSDVTVPDNRFLAKVAEKFSLRPEVTGMAFRLFKPDGETEDVERWWHPRSIEEFVGREFFTSYFSGTAYAFRREAAIEAGLYTEILYMHYEEVELAWRVMDAGGRILYVPDLAVCHHANPVSRRNQVEVFLKPRNQILLAVSCLPWARACAYVVPRTGFQCLKAIRRGHLGDFAKAMRSAIELLPRQMKARQPLKETTLREIDGLKSSTEATSKDGECGTELAGEKGVV